MIWALTGFTDVQVLNVEGPGSLVSDFEERWAAAIRRAAMSWAAELMESDPGHPPTGRHLRTDGSA